MNELLKVYLDVVDYRITDSFEHQYTCAKDNDILVWCSSDDPIWSAEIAFSTKTNEVFELNVCDYKNNRYYRYFPSISYREEYLEEERARTTFKLDGDIEYTELDDEGDFMEKFDSIVHGKSYDTRIVVPVDIPDDVFLKIAKLAHEADLTFNEYCCKVLQSELDLQKYENLGD